MKKMIRSLSLAAGIFLFVLTLLMACNNERTERHNSQVSSNGNEQLNQNMDSLNAVLNDTPPTGENPKYGN